MAKLYFFYGTMNSGKTLQLLAVRHSYLQQRKKPYLIKPEIDIRFGKDIVRTRAGEQYDVQANFVWTKGDHLTWAFDYTPDVLIVDECQFLCDYQIDILNWASKQYNIPVMCYGLRTDSEGHLFEGSRRLFEVADQLTEIKNMCRFCHNKANYNYRHDKYGNKLTGDSVRLESDETHYTSVCYDCFHLQQLPI